MNQFFKKFKENMEDLGLPVPTSLFETESKALVTIAALAVSLTKISKTATIGDLIAEGLLGRELTVGLAYLISLNAAFYLGACIGSFAVATGDLLARNMFTGSYPYKWVDKVLWRASVGRPACLQDAEFRPHPNYGRDWKNRA